MRESGASLLLEFDQWTDHRESADRSGKFTAGSGFNDYVWPAVANSAHLFGIFMFRTPICWCDMSMLKQSTGVVCQGLLDYGLVVS